MTMVLFVQMVLNFCSRILSSPFFLLKWFHSALYCLCYSLIVLSFVVLGSYRLGWLHRWAWHIAETEASKVLNGTPVTIGSLRLDVLRGRVWASNIIVHAPKRALWKWQSPVLARIGSAYVEYNLIQVIFFFWYGEDVPLDCVTIELSDVQCFVERKQKVFNFYLTDKHVDVPDPVEETTQSTQFHDAPAPFDGSLGADLDERSKESYAYQQQQNETGDLTAATSGLSSSLLQQQQQDGDASQPQQQQQALAQQAQVEQASQKLVDDMVRALGRAAQQGSLQDALLESRKTLTSQLKALQQKNNSVSHGQDNNHNHNNNNSSQMKTTQIMQAHLQQGVQIVQQVSKSLVTKTQTIPQVVAPARKQFKEEKIVYARVGRIVIQEMRVFTRDHQWKENSAAAAADGDITFIEDSDNDQPPPPQQQRQSSSSSSWNKPIYLPMVILRAAELCPPLSAKDTSNRHLPLVYQSIDKIMDVLVKRLLTEMAKSNTGHFFQTAMEAILDYWMEQEPLPTTTFAATANTANANTAGTTTE